MSVPTRLKGLRLRRVSLVDDPANELAKVLIHKSADEKSVPARAANCPNCGVTMTDTNKSADPLDRIEDPEAKAAVAKMKADLKAATDLLEQEAEKGKKKTDESDVLKGLSPEARAHVEKLQREVSESNAANKLVAEEVEKMRDERETDTYVVKARQYTNLSIKPADFGPVLKRLAKGKATAADVEELDRVLKAANEAAKHVFKVAGKNPTASGASGNTQPAGEVIKAKALEIVEKSAGNTDLPTAMRQVIKDNPELYAQHQNEMPTLANERAAEE